MTRLEVLALDGGRVLRCVYRPHVPGEKSAAIATVRQEVLRGLRVLPDFDPEAPTAVVERLPDGLVTVEAFDIVRNNWAGAAFAAVVREGPVSRSTYEFGKD